MTNGVRHPVFIRASEIRHLFVIPVSSFVISATEAPMPGHLKLDRLLSDADRAEFDQLIAHPGTTTARAHEWVRQRGYDVGHYSVYAYVCRYGPRKRKRQSFSKL